MEIIVYGHWGIPIIVFPTTNGKPWDFEDRGLLKSIENLLNDGIVKLYCVGSIDLETWENIDMLPNDKALKHNKFEKYIINDVIQFIDNDCQHKHKNIYTMGCSMGGYYACNMYLKYPEIFSGFLSLSGIYDVINIFTQGSKDIEVYYNSPLQYLPNIDDKSKYLEQIKKGKLIMWCGSGEGEKIPLENINCMKNIMKNKNIPCIVEIGNVTMYHDWVCWCEILKKYINILIEN